MHNCFDLRNMIVWRGDTHTHRPSRHCFCTKLMIRCDSHEWQFDCRFECNHYCARWHIGTLSPTTCGGWAALACATVATVDKYTTILKREGFAMKLDGVRMGFNPLFLMVCREIHLCFGMRNFVFQVWYSGPVYGILSLNANFGCTKAHKTSVSIWCYQIHRCLTVNWIIDKCWDMQTMCAHTKNRTHQWWSTSVSVISQQISSNVFTIISR